jgi:TldD protein
MSLSRRRFLELSAGAAAIALANELFGPPHLLAYVPGARTEPTPALIKLGEVALDEAKRLKATYADIRIGRYRNQIVSLRTQPNMATRQVTNVPSVSQTQTFGFGVRVIANGTWGFAASRLVTPEEIRRVTAEAVAVAKANSALQKSPVRLAPTSSYVDTWSTSFKRNSFDVPVPEKLALLEQANAEARKVQRVFAANSNLISRSEDKYFASSEGSRIQQYMLQTYGTLTAQAVDLGTRTSRSRMYTAPPQSGGWELIEAADLPGHARRVGEEVVEHLGAPPVTAGKKDLILMPNHLALTMHESIGHPTELDRVFGYEANFAGTSFLKPEDRGKLQYGSKVMNVVGDRTMPGGLSTVGYDDDGVKTVEFDIVKDGVFRNFQTIRDQAHLIGMKESLACCYGDSFDSIPFQRIPNVWLKPSPKETSLDDLIAAVDDGILIDGRGSFSIDQQRYNFQFGGDGFWEVKNGKRGNMISRVAYQSRTTDFWASMEATCDQRFWENQGLTNDGKGQPSQSNSMSHGCAPTLFRQVNVLVTD